jgi:hypothetical protein
VASSEPGGSRDQKQPCADGDNTDGPCDARTCESFGGDRYRYGSHRAKVHDPDDQEDRYETDTAAAAVEAEAQTVSQGRAGVRRPRATGPRFRAAAGKVMCLPRAELEAAGDQDDDADCHWYGARQFRLLHLDRRQPDAQWDLSDVRSRRDVDQVSTLSAPGSRRSCCPNHRSVTACARACRAAGK